MTEKYNGLVKPDIVFFGEKSYQRNFLIILIMTLQMIC